MPSPTSIRAAKGPAVADAGPPLPPPAQQPQAGAACVICKGVSNATGEPVPEVCPHGPAASPPAAQTAEAAAKAAAKDAATQARKRKRKKEKKAKKKERKKRTAKERWKDAAARTKPRSFVLWVSASAPQLTYAAGLRAFAAHEILTHVVRWSNEERQPWAHARPVERSPGRSQNTLLGH